MVRPSALAVLRLIARSNFDGCSTGSSPGLAPFRILSTYRVGDETAGGDELLPAAHRRQSVPHRELCDASAVSRREMVRHHDETLGPVSEDRREYRVQGGWVACQLE
jgi:hypothetical protein